VRELEQAVRRVLLTGAYEPERLTGKDLSRPSWLAEAEAGKLDADGVLAGYCRQLHAALGSYEAVAGRTRLDRRTVRKYVHMVEWDHERERPIDPAATKEHLQPAG
jgi:hypothetical protein